MKIRNQINRFEEKWIKGVKMGWLEKDMIFYTVLYWSFIYLVHLTETVRINEHLDLNMTDYS